MSPLIGCSCFAPSRLGSERVDTPAGKVATTDSLTWSHIKVTDYLVKRGYTKTEAVFRREAKYIDQNGRPLKSNEEMGSKKYIRAFRHLHHWVETGLDLYKVSFHAWPPDADSLT